MFVLKIETRPCPESNISGVVDTKTEGVDNAIFVFGETTGVETAAVIKVGQTILKSQTVTEVFVCTAVGVKNKTEPIRH